MGRLAWSQLRFRTVRLLALLLGLLLATTAFTVLTAASRTSQLRTVGTVSAHFVPAYEILVRPKGARTQLEQQTDTVQPNFLSGLYGGITLAQWHSIAKISGVSVAAPIAMVGYAQIFTTIFYPLPAAGPGKAGQLYRYSTTWVSDGGASRAGQPASFLYATGQRLGVNHSTGGTTIRLPDGKTADPCPVADVSGAPINPFGVAAQSDCDVWSTINGYGPGSSIPGFQAPTKPGYRVSWLVPVLIAAVDPASEAKLDGLNRAVISGHYLAENAGETPVAPIGEGFPVLASSASGMSEYAVTQLETLGTVAAAPAMTDSWIEAHQHTAGQPISTVTTTAQQAYQRLLANLAAKGGEGIPAYWSVGPTSYRRTPAGTLAAQPAHNPDSVWYAWGSEDASMDEAGNQYRRVVVHAPATPDISTDAKVGSAELVGTFNPAKVKSFDPLSQVPLSAYQATDAAPENGATRTALHGGDLLPNQNIAGYVSQPVDLITTLAALPALQSKDYYGTDLPVNNPISVVRVRVAGVTGPNSVSLARIKEVAQQIEVRTHLDVDIVAGSSPTPTTIALPAGKYGQPALTLSEDWVKKGVALTILTAVDKNSVVLFILILVVCVLFVANSAAAAIRGRRRELGVLAALGWTRPRLFTAVLGELAAIGLTAGVIGAALALPLSSALGLHASPGRASLAVPIAMAVAIVAGLIPAWLAARADPVTSVRPPVLGVRRGHQPGGVTSLAAVNVLRTPGRALVGAVSLAVGITALTLLTAITFAFRGVIVGTLLGDAVAVQVRGVDYVAAAATVALGVLAVADVIFLNITDRAAELAAIRTFGWRESALSRLVITEGAIIGLAGSAAGAALGLAGAAEFTGQVSPRLFLIAAAAVIAGVLVTALAALLPAQALRRLPAATLLAEE